MQTFQVGPVWKHGRAGSTLLPARMVDARDARDAAARYVQMFRPWLADSDAALVQAAVGGAERMAA